MSVQGVKRLRGLCNLLIRQNYDGKLKKGQNERDSAVQRANDILALCKLRSSRPWDSSNDELDVLIQSLRSTATERRNGANVRAEALTRLSFIELGSPELGADPMDDLIRKLLGTATVATVAPQAPQSKPSAIDAEMFDFDAVVARVRGENNGN
jgi:hypothetical protein